MNDTAGTLRPIDPLTLADIPGYTPIAVGDRWWHALSPDELTLALIVGDDASASLPGDAPRPSRLQLLDLAAWRVRTTPIAVSGEIGWLGFGPDGRTLYWLVFAGSLKTATPQRTYTLYRYRPGQAEAETLTTLSPGAICEEIRQSRSGRELIVYRVADGHASPQLDFLDLATGRIATTLPLVGIRATLPGTSADNQANAESFFPGLAWDSLRDRLYIAHPDNDRLTVIDLATRAIERQGAIGGPNGTPSDVKRLYNPGRTPTAGAQRSRFLAIDSSGTRLITRSRTVTVSPLPSGHWQEHSRVEAMRVLDARTGVAQGEFPIDSVLIAATGDGFLTQSVRFLSGSASTAPGDFRLRLWEGGDFREAWQRDTAPGDIWRVTLSPGEHFAYLMRPNAASFFREGEVVPYNQGNTFGIFDFRAKQVIAERQISGGQLLPLWRSP